MQHLTVFCNKTLDSLEKIINKNIVPYDYIFSQKLTTIIKT
jgi:hypothetical protein